MIFEQVHLGGDRNFAYLIADADSQEAAVVDPAFDPDKLYRRATEKGLTIKYILNTHGHQDHVNGNAKMKKLTGAPILAHPDDRVAAAREIDDGDVIELGGLEIKVLHTPGHSPGSVSFLTGDHLITGDCLFVGKVGGTGSFFPGSSPEVQWKSLARLMKLPDETKIFPGHNYYGGYGGDDDPPEKPSSTIGEERRLNPFLLCETFDDFVDLKENWATFKEEKGIR